MAIVTQLLTATANHIKLSTCPNSSFRFPTFHLPPTSTLTPQSFARKLNAMQHNSKSYKTVLFHTIHYNTIQSKTIQCNTVTSHIFYKAKYHNFLLIFPKAILKETIHFEKMRMKEYGLESFFKYQ